MLVDPYYGDLFFRLWTPMCACIDTKILRTSNIFVMSTENLYGIGEKIVENPGLIDRYLKKNPQFQGEKKEIILSWKRGMKGHFAIMEFRPDGSMFMDIESGMVYKVAGLKDNIDYMVGKKVPVLVMCQLFPLKDWIVTGGTLQQIPISFTKELLAELNEMYRNALAEENFGTL